MGRAIVVFDLRGPAAGERPLMLQPLLFCPVLTWACRELAECGTERFFVICDGVWRPEAEAAVACFGGAVLTGEEAAPAGAIVIAAPVLPLADETSDCGLLSFSSEEELERAAAEIRRSQLRRLRQGGVTVIDPANTYIDPTCTVGRGAVLLPGTVLRGKTRIGEDCTVGPNAMIRDSVIGAGSTVNASQVNESTVGAGTTVGPFAYVRPGTVVGDGCRVGDFVELKNSVIGDGTKISHLTYVGDSDVGQRVNFGCGTVTTNYDGKRKYRCTIGDDVFIGCNTNLVAPVTLGDGSYTAAGSTVTQDVPAGALAVARARQCNKDGWASRFMQREKK